MSSGHVLLLGAGGAVARGMALILFLLNTSIGWLFNSHVIVEYDEQLFQFADEHISSHSVGRQQLLDCGLGVFTDCLHKGEGLETTVTLRTNMQQRSGVIGGDVGPTQRILMAVALSQNLNRAW